jgi:hypothetical protein
MIDGLGTTSIAEAGDKFAQLSPHQIYAVRGVYGRHFGHGPVLARFDLLHTVLSPNAARRPAFGVGNANRNPDRRSLNSIRRPSDRSNALSWDRNVLKEPRRRREGFLEFPPPGPSETSSSGPLIKFRLLYPAVSRPKGRGPIVVRRPVSRTGEHRNKNSGQQRRHSQS